MAKMRVGIIFGGRSAEHEISIRSARSIVKNLDPQKYETILMGIDKIGKWYFGKDAKFFLEKGRPAKRLLLEAPKSKSEPTNEIHIISNPRAFQTIEVIFPVLHGPYGEDGTMQGFLKLAGLPFVGPSVLGSAIAMDKDVMKRLFREANIPTPKFIIVDNCKYVSPEKIIKELALPLFIKPANMGSSVGIHKVRTKIGVIPAIRDSLQYDRKVIIEEYIDGREIECAVLGNDNPTASIPGEIIPADKHEFYSYEAKYLDENGALLKIPADLPDHTKKQIQELAIKSFKTLCCEGMSRVDLFLRGEKEIFVNELNTIPGFTSISMYPKLWEASGISYPRLLDMLIQFAIERFEKEQKLKLVPKI